MFIIYCLRCHCPAEPKYTIFFGFRFSRVAQQTKITKQHIAHTSFHRQFISHNLRRCKWQINESEEWFRWQISLHFRMRTRNFISRNGIKRWTRTCVFLGGKWKDSEIKLVINDDVDVMWERRDGEAMEAIETRTPTKHRQYGGRPFSYNMINFQLSGSSFIHSHCLSHSRTLLRCVCLSN